MAPNQKLDHGQGDKSSTKVKGHGQVRPRHTPRKGSCRWLYRYWLPTIIAAERK